LLASTCGNPSLEQLIGNKIAAPEFRTDRARDPVVVVKLQDGGVISYKKPDGKYVHTLNTQEGFERKLVQLGISLHRASK
jgi:hypothetical protein